MLRRPLTLTLAVAVLAAGLAVGGCGGGSESDRAPAAAASAHQADQPEQSTTAPTTTKEVEQAPVPSQTGMPKASIVTIEGAPAQISLASAAEALGRADFPLREKTNQKITRYILHGKQADLVGVSLYRDDALAKKRGYVIALEFRDAQVAGEMAKVLANQDRGKDVHFYVAGNLVVGYIKVPGGTDHSAEAEQAVRALASSIAP